MIRKYLLDILFALVIFSGAFLIAERTGIEIPERRTPPPKEKRPDLQKEEKKEQGSEIIRQIGSAETLKERNFFGSGDGKTPAGVGKTARSAENPISLIGILQGEEKRAVFLEPGGKIVALVVGKNLADGSVITRIDDLSVQVEKGNEKKDLKVFDLTKQADSKASSRPDRDRLRQEAGTQPRPERAPPQRTPPQVQGEGGQQQMPRVPPRGLGERTPQKTERARPQPSGERPSRRMERQASPSQ